LWHNFHPILVAVLVVVAMSMRRSQQAAEDGTSEGPYASSAHSSILEPAGATICHVRGISPVVVVIVVWRVIVWSAVVGINIVSVVVGIVIVGIVVGIVIVGVVVAIVIVGVVVAIVIVGIVVVSIVPLIVIAVRVVCRYRRHRQHANHQRDKDSDVCSIAHNFSSSYNKICP
jgi:hypothetical protein